MTQVACIGECMIELREEADGRLSRGYGGDTFNTAVYLARLGTPTDYITALGDDSWSDELITAWNKEGVGTQRVLRLPGRLPGLYIIQTDAKGERRFSYWRETAAARLLFQAPEAASIIEAIGTYDLAYLSGISLSLYGESGRERLFDVLRNARSNGRLVAFDTNFRPRGWPDPDVARAAFREAFACADIILASTEDLDLLFGSKGVEELLAFSGKAEIVLKHPDLTCRVLSQGEDILVPGKPAEDVVDTTAAGDSFAAAYLNARLSGESQRSAAAAGHRLAGQVVRYRGAIIPREAMP
ncbi:sugar kinase [Microvirga lotononidis]|uniref:2-dehydro-3-deoxygluconokinase n=1 Tax=Microvirga lotononidis TaxID=864069 RepID=I4YVC1_9HYPH|nr:sugar kinase [Microvirga lotononidis]EIM27913.1 sugar kinase, ribokinase [Microvirga lotononidis]WQO27962.1 sugar kinase [Microvirga lotononidis]